MGDGFYMLKDPTDSIKVLKEIKSARRPMSVKLWYNLNKNRPTVVRFVTKSPNDNVSPKTLVFSGVEMLQKFEGYHPSQFSTATPILAFRKL